jgi:hypothetical protein
LAITRGLFIREKRKKCLRSLLAPRAGTWERQQQITVELLRVVDNSKVKPFENVGSAGLVMQSVFSPVAFLENQKSYQKNSDNEWRKSGFATFNWRSMEWKVYCICYLGLLSPSIAERIHRKHRQHDLIDSVVGELTELQYTIAVLALNLRSKLTTETHEFIDWLLPIIRAYNGPGKSPRLEDTMTKIREFSEEQLQQADITMNGENMGLTLKHYELPFLLTQANELSICSLDFQRRVFRVKGQLDLFNQQVSFQQSQYEKTFDTSIIGANRVAVEKNLTNGYAILATDAESIARAIGEIISRYGSAAVDR